MYDGAIHRAEDDAKVSSGRPARSRDDSISAKQGESDIEYDVSEQASNHIVHLWAIK